MLDFIVSWTTDRSLKEQISMFDHVAHASAQRQTADEALSALPNSPLRPDRRRSGVRRRASVALRWLADRLDPAPTGGASALADGR